VGAALVGTLVTMALLASSAWAAAAWQPPVDLSDPGKTASNPQVGVDASGAAVAVWERSNGANTIIQSASRPAGGPWSAPVDLSVAGQNASAPQIAVEADGDAVAVWRRYDGAAYVIQAASRPADGSWGAPVSLSAAGQSTNSPEIAVGPNGSAVAVWERYDGADWIIQAASKAAGGAWSAPVNLTAAGLSAASPQVAIDASGTALALWERSDGVGYVTQAASKPAGGTWGAPKSISAAGKVASGARLALDPGGNATAVWESYDGGTSTIQAASKPAGGNWGAPVNLSEAGKNALNPRVAVDASGNAVTIWVGLNNSVYSIQTASKPAGGAWGQPANLSAPGQTPPALQLAVAPGGAAVAVWTQQNGPASAIQAANKPAGGAWGAPANLTTAGLNASSPQVAIAPSGDAVAVWTRLSATGVIQAAGFDASGPELRGLAIPSRGVVGRKLAFSVSPLDAWSPLAATEWSFGDGKRASGTSVKHAYAAAGTYSVTVTATDALGNSSQASGIVKIAAAKARARRALEVKAGAALLTLTCPAGRCRGVAKLSVQRGKRRLALGKARFALPAGKRKTIKIPLSRRGRALLEAKGARGLRARLAGTGLTPRGVVLKP